jgi:hypothetical protein
MLRRGLLPAAVSGAVLLACGHAAAQTAAEYYDQNCAACHTIGQGASGGPDLKDVTRRRDREWLIRFLLNPDALASDSAVIQMIKDAGGMEMPKAEGLTREMAEALLAVIEQRSSSVPHPRWLRLFRSHPPTSRADAICSWGGHALHRAPRACTAMTSRHSRRQGGDESDPTSRWCTRVSEARRGSPVGFAPCRRP